MASDAAAHCDAVSYYSSALTLDNLSTDLLIRRSRAHTTLGNWEAAVEDANTVCFLWFLIAQFPMSCILGYLT